MQANPLVSIMLCVRNGMPYLQRAVESILAQTYEPYEVVVQDGASTDGTLDFLAQFEGRPGWFIVSAPDTGIGQAFNRSVGRCRGDIVCSVDSDNEILPDALATAVQMFTARPELAVVYGACTMMDADRNTLNDWLPPEFDLLGLIDGAVVPPFATSFFSRRVCGEELRFDESLPTVADFDLWLRLAHLPIARTFERLARVGVGPQSSTWTPSAYEGHSRYKIQVLTQYLEGSGQPAVLAAILRRGVAGIHLWAADSLKYIGAEQSAIEQHFEAALEGDLLSERFRRVATAVRPRRPAGATSLLPRLLKIGIESLHCSQPEAALVYFRLIQDWEGSSVELDAWIARSERLLRDQARIRADDTVREMQAEIDRRDALLAAQRAEQGEEVGLRDREIARVSEERLEAVNLRDQLIDDLRGELERLTRGWRRIVVGRARL